MAASAAKAQQTNFACEDPAVVRLADVARPATHLFASNRLTCSCIVVGDDVLRDES